MFRVARFYTGAFFVWLGLMLMSPFDRQALIEALNERDDEPPTVM
jgi:hypothetical protein